MAIWFSATCCKAADINIRVTNVPLLSTDQKIKLVSRLKYRGGLLLRSDNLNFGGFSALGISADGKRLISLSDRGYRLAANLEYDSNMNLINLKDGNLIKMNAPGGAPLLKKSLSDAEAMSPGVRGEIIVAFERQHRLWRYLPNNPEPRPMLSPNGIEKLPSNNGIEALTLLFDGSLLAIAEGDSRRSETIAWISNVNGWSPLTYKLANQFLPTGAATLKNGDVVTLERFYNSLQGNKTRIRLILKTNINPGSELDGVLLAELAPPFLADNFEGIDARTNGRNETIIYIISDDNFNPSQRTYLLMFEIID